MRLYKDVSWEGRSFEVIMSCLQGSQLCIGIVDESNNLIGFTRIVNDFTYKAFIFDVMVNVNHRGHGLGREVNGRENVQ